MAMFEVSGSVRIQLACALVALAAGCGSTPLDNTGGAGTGGSIAGQGGGSAGRGGGGASGGRSGGAGGRNVDILFLIDDSSSMQPSQMNLERNFPAFIRSLEGLPGGLPDLHLAVVSSDMGAGDGSISGCAGEGKGGIFRYSPRGACTATNLAAGATYISNIAGTANYTGNLEDVFTCIAALGDSGCGFEQQLRAIVRALGADGRAAPAENQGFLRPDAYLFIVMLTNEDDCSTPPGSLLFDIASNLTLAAPLGPPSNFRCNEFGHLCTGGKPPRRAPTGNVMDTVTLSDCVPAEANGMLTPIATLLAQIRALKADPDHEIVVSAITGPTTPYQVHWKNPSTIDTGPWPEITHSCTATDTSFADPAVRIGAFVDAFGTNGIKLSICDNSYAPALQIIGERVGQTISPP
jgi:hypothetical protein